MNFLAIFQSKFEPSQSLSLLACGALCLTLTACGKTNSAPNPKSTPATDAVERAVRVAPVRQLSLEKSIPAFGSLAAREYATLSIKVTGRVKEILVDLGSVVQAGQPLARIEPRDYELRRQQSEAMLAQARALLGLPLQGDDDKVDLPNTSLVKQARALLEEATKNRERTQALSRDGILSKSELDSIETSYQVAMNGYDDALEEASNRLAQLAQRRAEFEIAKQQLSDTTVTAPFAGTVAERRANVGDYVTAGAHVLTLVQLDPLRLRLDIPERDAQLVKAGQAVRLSLEGDTNRHTGKITRLSPILNNETRMLRVEADVPNTGSLRPGAFARSEIIVTDSKPGLVIPKPALVVFAGMEKAFIVEKGAVVERRLTTGRRTADSVEVLSGLKENEQVILEPGGLQSGQPVRVIQ